MDEENLFPEDIDELDEDIDELDEDDDESIGYKIAPFFDSRLGEFMMNGSGQVIDADGVTAWQQWCENIVATDRYNHDSYTDDVGIDYEEIFQAESQEEIETLLETEISEALECDPFGRTQFVQNVEFEWLSSSEVIVRIDVVGIENEIISIEKTISTAT